MTLAEADVERIIQGFADATLDPKQWMPALQVMSDAMGSASSALELADLNTGEAAMNCTFPLDGDIVDLYEERIYHINPRIRRARQAAIGAIIDDRALLVDGDPHMGEFMDWLRVTPHRYVKGAKLFHAGGHEIYFGSYFAESQGPPETWHHEAHSHIVPHLVNYIRAGRVLSNGKLNNELLQLDALHSDRPFALLSRCGRILECSKGFERLIQSKGVIDTRHGVLVASRPRDRKKFENFLRAALGDTRLVEPPLPIRLIGPRSPRGIVMRAIPLAASNDVFDVFRPRSLVTIADLDADSSIAPEELVTLFGLTIREAEVAGLIGTGRSTSQAATALSLTEHTIRHHLKAIFSKLHISRQSELVALVTKLRWPGSR
jgi:DNA-binding CsgD family transcriptional regulator